MLGLSKKILPSLARFQKTVAIRGKHTLPTLPYDFHALEPVICREIMEIHYSKHHQTYVTNLNAAEEQLKDAISKCDVAKMTNLMSAIKFNGGGHINHSIFWENLTACCTEPSEQLNLAFRESFGCFDNFKTEFINMTIGIQGSGWGWLGYNKFSKKLQLATCANQDPLQATTGLIPLLGIDVWEHAYYLQYKNVRKDYVEAIFTIVNWIDVSARLAKAQC